MGSLMNNLRESQGQQEGLHQGQSRLVFNTQPAFYDSVLLNPSTLAVYAKSAENWAEILGFHSYLVNDKYTAYLDGYYRRCRELFGAAWMYYDIVNVLFAASKLAQPKNYLEIGVRRGRSVCTVAKGCPTVNIFAFDMWQQNYAGMDNPGPDFVQNELKKAGHQGRVSFFNGNSHETLPQFFSQNPGLQFDMITVDGDHTEQGALQDLRDVIPHIALGGVLVFDDICHPQHPYLLQVWRTIMAENLNFKFFEYTDAGYGIAFAIRMS